MKYSRGYWGYTEILIRGGNGDKIQSMGTSNYFIIRKFASLGVSDHFVKKNVCPVPVIFKNYYTLSSISCTGFIRVMG